MDTTLTGKRLQGSKMYCNQKIKCCAHHTLMSFRGRFDIESTFALKTKTLQKGAFCKNDVL